MKFCPYCGSDSGFYTKDYVYGSCVFYCNFDGSEAEDNSSMYDTLQHKRGKCAYCSECDKYLGPLSKILKENYNE